jgi:hypothetical protein
MSDLSDMSDGGHVREAEWVNPCRVYTDHQASHRQMPDGWTCDTCYPEEPA